MTRLRAVSLFSNCGAGDVGFRQAGFEFEVMAELDPRRLAVALRNHPGAHGIPGDICHTWQAVIDVYRSRAGVERPSLLAACPPCQGMSSARGKAVEDDRNLLVVPIAAVALRLKPRLIVVENVAQFLTRKVLDPRSNQPISAARLLIDLIASEYHAFPIVADLEEWGVPQYRKRAFLTFVHREEVALTTLRRGELSPYPIPYRAPDHGGSGPIRLRDALRAMGLPRLDARTAKKARDPERRLHAVPVWTDRRYPMVAAIPKHRGATAWENSQCERCGRDQDVGPDATTCPTCAGPLLRPLVFEGDEWRLVKGFRSSSYRRMTSNEPAATITTATGHVGSSITIHPSQNRLLSPLECSGLQTFPPSFDWGNALELWGPTNVREMIGEAVPPLFTFLHGVVLRGLLTGTRPVAMLSALDPRCKRARARLQAKKRRTRGSYLAEQSQNGD
jgi:DNA (cytosine-5)-methyltransferase 1